VRLCGFWLGRWLRVPLWSNRQGFIRVFVLHAANYTPAGLARFSSGKGQLVI
jgi:hypothetical protein